MRVDFRYSLAIDLARVLFSLENLKFYKNKDYQVYLPRISEDLKRGVIDHRTDKYDYFLLLELLSKEFEKNKKKYQKIKNNLSTHWKNIEGKKIYKRIEGLTGSKLPKRITCYLTIWGSGGSEIPPDKVLIRVFTPATFKRTVGKQIGYEKYTNRVGFELVELALHKFQEKYKISQEKYIRVVDRVLGDTKCFYSSMHMRGDYSIDDLYEKYKSNLEDLFKLLS